MSPEPRAEDSFKTYIGQGGVYDTQRDASAKIAYTDPQTVAGANYLVGRFSAAAGLTKVDTYALGMAYGLKNSSNYLSLGSTDAPMWFKGADDYYDAH